jgi:hypothetical protein
LIHDGLVYALATFLQRWKCLSCGRTFRHYPPGVAPYKHYLADALAGLCRRYLNEPPATYRRVARAAGPRQTQPLFHAAPVAQPEWTERQKEHEQLKALAHSTPWRWMAFWAFLWERRRAAGQPDPGDAADLAPWRIGPHKYRSRARYRTLVLAASIPALAPAPKCPTGFETRCRPP